MKRAKFLQKMREVQVAVSNNVNNNVNNNGDTSFVEIYVVSLQKQETTHMASYSGIVGIGGQSFRVMIDTGSREFWVPGPRCKEFTPASICDIHHRFNPTLSPTYQRYANGEKMSLRYVSGKLEGPLGYDTVSLGALTVPHQTFAAANQINIPLMSSVQWDGILGLAYPYITPGSRNVHPLFDHVMRQKLLKKNIFSYYLGHKGGALTFGSVNTKYLAVAPARNPLESFAYVKVVKHRYWTIGIEDIELQYGNDPPISTGVCENKPNNYCLAIVDTGTSNIYGPHDQFQGSLHEIFIKKECEHVANLPTVIFVLHAGDGSKPVRMRLKPQDYVLTFEDKVHDKSHCVVGIAPSRANSLYDWTLGQVFLKPFYTVFDRDLNRIGFARAI